jgi:hypothetical protein
MLAANRLLDEEPALGPYILGWLSQRVLLQHPGLFLAYTVREDREPKDSAPHAPLEWTMDDLDDINAVRSEFGKRPRTN